MDIDLLSKMVKELILDNDRVVLPGLGCFVAEIVPSVFSDKGYTINPPYRKLSFRARPDSGEELARFYAGTNSVGYDVADRIITDFVADLKTVLHQKKTVVFPGLGRLRATKENNVFFVADENLDIYPAGFGLEPISLKTHQQTREEVSAAIEGLRSIIGEEPATDSVKSEVPDIVPGIPCAVSDEDVTPRQEDASQQEDSLQQTTEASQQEGPLQQTEPPQEGPLQQSEPQQEGPLQQTGAEPESEKVSVTETEAVTVIETEAVTETDAVTEVTAKRPVRKIILWTMAGIALLLIVAIAAYMALAIYAPEILDGILYTPEELDILNYKL